MTDVTLMRSQTTAPESDLGRVPALVRWIWRRYAAARAANEQAKGEGHHPWPDNGQAELAALDDRMLADVGLSRGQIGEASRAPRFR